LLIRYRTRPPFYDQQVGIVATHWQAIAYVASGQIDTIDSFRVFAGQDHGLHIQARIMSSPLPLGIWFGHSALGVAHVVFLHLGSGPKRAMRVPN
jgi:hypothetical protein